MNAVWILIFVISTNSNQSGSASVAVELNSKEACLAAQNTLLEQARLRSNYVLLNMCVKK